MEIVIEFSVAMLLDAVDTDLMSFTSDVNQVIRGDIEFLHAGEWTTFNDALAQWLLQVLPEEVLPEYIRSVSVVTAETPRRYGRVSASQLNVRSQPGTDPDNPVVGTLPKSSYVTIFEEQAVDGEPWFRIGPKRWIHSSFVDLLWGFGGGGGVGTSGRTRAVTARKPPRKASRGGSAKPASETG